MHMFVHVRVCSPTLSLLCTRVHHILVLSIVCNSKHLLNSALKALVIRVLFPRMVRVFMDADGGTCEFKYLGVTLDVPQDSIDNIELQISCISPSDASIRQNPLRLAFGDYMISDIIKIGPDGLSLRRPASLSIPYSIFEVPPGRHIVMKCFNEEENSWDSIQVELKKGKLTSLYLFAFQAL